MVQNLQVATLKHIREEKLNGVYNVSSIISTYLPGVTVDSYCIPYGKYVKGKEFGENDNTVKGFIIKGWSGGDDAPYTNSQEVLYQDVNFRFKSQWIYDSNKIQIAANGNTLLLGSNYKVTVAAKEGYRLTNVSYTYKGRTYQVTDGNINISDLKDDVIINAEAEIDSYPISYSHNIGPDKCIETVSGNYPIEIENGETLDITLKPGEHYTTIGNITVTMGDQPVSVTNNRIYIENVTGRVLISTECGNLEQLSIVVIGNPVDGISNPISGQEYYYSYGDTPDNINVTISDGYEYLDYSTNIPGCTFDGSVISFTQPLLSSGTITINSKQVCEERTDWGEWIDTSDCENGYKTQRRTGIKTNADCTTQEVTQTQTVSCTCEDYTSWNGDWVDISDCQDGYKTQKQTGTHYKEDCTSEEVTQERTISCTCEESYDWNDWEDTSECVEGYKDQKRTGIHYKEDCTSEPVEETRTTSCTCEESYSWGEWKDVSECIEGKKTQEREGIHYKENCTEETVTQAREIDCTTPCTEGQPTGNVSYSEWYCDNGIKTRSVTTEYYHADCSTYTETSTETDGECCIEGSIKEEGTWGDWQCDGTTRYRIRTNVYYHDDCTTYTDQERQESGSCCECNGSYMDCDDVITPYDEWSEWGSCQSDNKQYRTGTHYNCDGTSYPINDSRDCDCKTGDIVPDSESHSDGNPYCDEATRKYVRTYTWRVYTNCEGTATEERSRTEIISDGSCTECCDGNYVIDASDCPQNGWVGEEQTINKGEPYCSGTNKIQEREVVQNYYDCGTLEVNKHKRDVESIVTTCSSDCVTCANGLTLSTYSINERVGSTGTISATVNPNNASNNDVTITSSNSNVVTISKNGNTFTYNIVGSGSATLTAVVNSTDCCSTGLPTASVSVTGFACPTAIIADPPVLSSSGGQVTFTIN